MDFQLVLQLSGKLVPDFDALVELEGDLLRVLGNTAEVDGHDLGAGEANIFILTTAPELCFELLTPLLKSKRLLSAGFKAAFRPVPDDAFTVLWPEGSGKFTIA